MLDPRLHDYQRRAVEHLHGAGRGAGLFMDMGLGKTATVLQALTEEHLPALVLAPRRVADEVWAEEVEDWRPDLSLRNLANVGPTREYPREAERRAALLRDASGADLTVITRDQVGCMGERKHPYRTVVLDESSGYKNYSTNRHRDTRRVTGRADHVWALTGTPAPNGYMDLWAQAFLLDGGQRLYPRLGQYRSRYFEVGKRHPVTNVVIRWDIKPGAEDSINAALGDICLSMRQEDYLELPDLTFNEVKVPLPAGVRGIADDLRRDLTVDLDILGTVSTASSATLSGRLRQLSAGFLYADGDTSRAERLHHEKARAVVEIVEGTGSPVLVFYQFQEEMRMLHEALSKAGLGPRWVGEKGVTQRGWNAGEYRVMLAHPASAGHGLNLQKGPGHTMVYASLPWSLEEWDQSVHRLHRQGQRSAVVCHVLLSPGLPDREVFRSLHAKEAVQDGLMEYLREGHLWL